MIYASIIVEAVRARPALVFWLAAVIQAGLWAATPSLVYSAPPGNLATVLAIGHELRLGSAAGPPLAYWLAEGAFDLAGGRMVGPYIAAQVCVLVTLWSLVALGREIVGMRHSVLAVLLIAGISAMTVATPDFGPSMLAMPLWSLAMLHAWRAVGQADRKAWFMLSLALGLLLLTSYVGLLLIATLDIFLLATRRGRVCLRGPEPWLCGLMVAIIVAPYAGWLYQHREMLLSALPRLQARDPLGAGLLWLRLIGLVFVAHAGVVLLVALASGWPLERKCRAPAVDGDPRDPLGRRFVLYFAVVPALAFTIVMTALGEGAPLVAIAPLVVMSGLAVVTLAGVKIRLSRQRLLAPIWLGLLLAPPAIIALGATAVPRLVPIDLPVAQPAAAIGGYFAEIFQRRTGRPLALVTGDPRLASLIAAAAAGRPRVFIDERTTPWLSDAEIRTQGGVIVWPAIDTRGAPPPAIAARFPGLVPEVPQTFERTLHGFGAPVRVGWAMLRPQSQ